MKQIGILLLMVLLGRSLHAQIDTIELKKLVPTSLEIFDHKRFWDYIFQRDQETRKSPAIETIDEENLILVSYYFNTFGYPDYKRIGDKANIINMVWTHNRSNKVKEITAPIIISGFSEQGISESLYRDYYLRILYQRKYDDYGYKTKPLDAIYKELGIQAANKLSIGAIMNGFAEFEVLCSDTPHIIGNWITPMIQDTNELNGKTLISTIKGTRVQIYQSSNYKIYLRYLYSDNSYDPVELERSTDPKNIFREKNVMTSRYYELSSEGDLMYHNPNHSIHLKYRSIE